MTLLLAFLIGYAALLAALFAWLVRGTARTPPLPPIENLDPRPRAAEGPIVGWIVRDPPANEPPLGRATRID